MEIRTVNPIDFGGQNVVEGTAVEIQSLFLVAKMPQPVPLRAGLGVEVQDVIVDRGGGDVGDGLGERDAIEGGRGNAIQRPVGGDANPIADFARGGTGSVGGEEIQHATLVVGSK